MSFYMSRLLGKFTPTTNGTSRAERVLNQQPEFSDCRIQNFGGSITGSYRLGKCVTTAREQA